MTRYQDSPSYFHGLPNDTTSQQKDAASRAQVTQSIDRLFDLGPKA